MINLLNIFIPQKVIAQEAWKDACVSNGDVATIKGFECLFSNILQIIVYVAGFSFLAIFIVGGFKYLTAGGDPKKAASASSTLTLAVIGLVGVIVSWFILLFIKNFTGVDVTKFQIGS